MGKRIRKSSDMAIKAYHAAIQKRIDEGTEIEVPTTDDWYPTINGTVTATIWPPFPTKTSTGKWRVCFWGGDDTGMEKDFVEYEDAKAMFDLTTQVGNITRKELEDLGFKYA